MKRYALCLMGIVGGTDGSFGLGNYIDFKKCHQHYTGNIIKNNNTDIFIHCWNVELERTLVDLYKPKKYLFEKMPKGSKDDKVFAHFCRWESNKKVIEIKKQYEDQQKFKYDLVMVGRFDTMWLRQVNFDRLSPDFFYVSNYNTFPGYLKSHKYLRNNLSSSINGLQDIWFLANSKSIDYLGTLHDRLKHGSFKCKCCEKIRRHYPHQAVQRHLHLGGYDDKIRYVYYRGFDYELYRWRVLGKKK